MFETFLGQHICSHVGELESPGQAQAWCPIKSSKKDSGRMIPVRQSSDAMIFELLKY